MKQAIVNRIIEQISDFESTSDKDLHKLLFCKNMRLALNQIVENNVCFIKNVELSDLYSYYCNQSNYRIDDVNSLKSMLETEFVDIKIFTLTAVQVEEGIAIFKGVGKSESYYIESMENFIKDLNSENKRSAVVIKFKKFPGNTWYGNMIAALEKGLIQPGVFCNTSYVEAGSYAWMWHFGIISTISDEGFRLEDVPEHMVYPFAKTVIDLVESDEKNKKVIFKIRVKI